MKTLLAIVLGLVVFQATIEDKTTCLPSGTNIKNVITYSDKYADYLTDDVDDCLFRTLQDSESDLICCLFEVEDVEFCRALKPLQYADITHYVEVLEDRYDYDVDIDCNAKYLTLGFLALLFMLF